MTRHWYYAKRGTHVGCSADADIGFREVRDTGRATLSVHSTPVITFPLFSDNPENFLKGLEMNGTVLIVEDDTRIANWVKLYFERAGFFAEVTHDGASGLSLARSLAPDLIVLDLMLPRLDGVELCRILRRESDVPIIMLTAREAHVERITGLDSGADDYIIKPFDPDEVVGPSSCQGQGPASPDARQHHAE